MKYENGDVTFKCGEKSTVVSIDDCSELKDIENLHTFLELDFETGKGIINDNDRTAVEVEHAVDIEALRTRLCTLVKVSKREALLAGFNWVRNPGDSYEISVTSQDSVTLLVECKAQFELDAMSGNTPNVEIVTFENGTVVRDLKPNELESILVQASNVRSAIERQHAVVD